MKRLSHKRRSNKSYKKNSKSNSRKKSRSSQMKRKVSRKSLKKLSGGSRKKSSIKRKSLKRHSKSKSSSFKISKNFLSRAKSVGFASSLELQKKMREELAKQSNQKYQIRGGPVFTTLVKTYNTMAKQQLPNGDAVARASKAFEIFKNDNIQKRIDEIISKGVIRKPRKSKKSKSVESNSSSD